MKTTITVFVEPDSLMYFLEVLNTLSGLPIDTNYVFNPKDLVFNEGTISNWIRVNIPVEDYLKLKRGMRINQSNKK